MHYCHFIDICNTLYHRWENERPFLLRCIIHFRAVDKHDAANISRTINQARGGMRSAVHGVRRNRFEVSWTCD